MNRRVLLLVIGSLPTCLTQNFTVQSASGQVPPVLQASELCSDHPAAAIATFEDANLEARVRAALSLGPQDDVTCRSVSGLTRLDAERAGIENLVGIQNLTSLTELGLFNNSITDISALRGLIGLRELRLSSNPGLSNIQPLLDNPWIDNVSLLGTSASCKDVALLEGNGVFVFSACS